MSRKRRATQIEITGAMTDAGADVLLAKSGTGVSVGDTARAVFETMLSASETHTVRDVPRAEGPELAVLNKEQFREVIRRVRSDVTDEEFNQAWDEFQDKKANGQL